ncbi:MAG: hydrogenase expression/formation protein HypD [Parcubacteria group bacterium Athens0714_25]|nr:MAG: hydrogenase expression/formation protein HypD [Parcubacteria group bacterium Athens0714_25]
MQQESIKEIKKLAKGIGREVNLMEVCGTHTQAISRSGIRGILPKNINLITGPGCPVCVTSQKDIDAIVSLALAGIPVATYGDMLRVPGRFGSLNEAREKGAAVFDVYSTEDALKLQKKHPELVFFGLGFDTTAPMTAWAIKKGLTTYSTHKTFLPAMKALLEMGEIRIDGFIDPGHVSAIIGSEPYEVLNVAQVITGFETQDILEGILMLLRQIKDERKDVENQYSRVVKKEGNEKARGLILEVFEIGNGDWRGFGIIPGSGLEIKNEFSKYDAKKKHKNILDKIDFEKSKDPAGCACGEVIRGLKTPKKCPMFGKRCTPENPVGPCMVSVEGACNNFFKENNQ